MNNRPKDIIAITVKRYLNTPNDKSFWKEYKRLKKVTPQNLIELINQYSKIEELQNRLMQKPDELLFTYINSLDGSSVFPVDSTIILYEKKYFTPNDNDFYNRVIYENQIEKLNEEINKLKLDLNKAIEAKKSFVSRDYEFIRLIGEGGFGKVSLVKHRISEQLYAAKRLADVEEEKQVVIQKEIKALASISHTNIINYRHSFSVGKVLFLIMDYCKNGTLHDKIKRTGKLSENEIISVFLTLTKTFKFLHQNNIIHHDIKPSNFLFDDNNEINISDFGCVNTSLGTRSYLPPEFYYNNYTPNPQTDIFALGITLMESALGYNPLFDKSVDEIDQIIKTADLPINGLPLWLQSTILKAVHYDINVRFKTMKEFHESLVKRNIPQFLNRKVLTYEKDANRLSMYIKTKKWEKARKFIEAQEDYFLKNLNLSLNAGTLYLNTHKISKAKKYFENALMLNPHTNLEKQIAEVYLQSGQAVKASSLLTGYINRNFNDLEAHIQLLYSYYQSERWELGLEQAELLLEIFPNEQIVKNNHAIFCYLLQKISHLHDTNFDDSFGSYNWGVYTNNSPESWFNDNGPALYDKIIFQEYKFRNIGKAKNTLVLKINGTDFTVSDKIVSLGRNGFDYNTYSDFEGTSVSRRHFIIINMKNNVWLYDLNSTGVYVDGKRVVQKAFLLGLHTIRFGNYEIELKTDDNLLM